MTEQSMRNEEQSPEKNAKSLSLGELSDFRGANVDYESMGEVIVHQLDSGVPPQDIGRFIELAADFVKHWSDKEVSSEVASVIERLASEYPETMSINGSKSLKTHQQIGGEMELFVQVPFAPGSPVLLPNGFVTYSILQTKMRDLLKRIGGYQEVRAPVLVKQDLLKTSGHMDKYEENIFMFNDGRDDLALKPMNCPVHMKIFDMKQRSYRDLPLRYHDESTLHRKEKSGQLNCMARLQQFHQDDSHIFVTADQLPGELERLIKLIERVYSKVGMDISIRLSTRPDKWIGSEEVWKSSEETLRQVLETSGIPFSVDEGGGAFYGPKIDVDVHSSLGKPWQMATSQLDMSLPERFDLSYIDSNGDKQRPILIHSALFGATERFLAMYTEHTQGAFPFWLAPEQVRVLPISDKFASYAEKVADELKSIDLRVNVDDGKGTLSSKIKAARPMQTPYLAIVGEREMNADTVSLRIRGQKKQESMTLKEFKQQCIQEDNFSF